MVPDKKGSTPSSPESEDDYSYNDFLKVINVSSFENNPSSSSSPQSSMRNRSKSNGAATGVVVTGTGWAGSFVRAPSPSPQDRAERSSLDDENLVTIQDDQGDDDKLPVEEEELDIPESTHSFLFTEPVGSMPFMFGMAIIIISDTCLLLALIYNLRNGEVPANVDITVKIAQYMAIFIVLLMEEEIPTGLYLLRRIPRSYLKKNFPQVKYSRFVFSAVMRIVMGYTFLVNVVVVLVQADGVIDIFYDVLALQFIQQLDDIGFRLSKIDVLGKRLQRATRTPFFQFDFVKDTETKSGKFRLIGLFLKTIYFVNLLAFLAVMVVVTVQQATGYRQCDEITFNVGESVFDDAVVNWPDGSQKQMKLVYSYFNGVYAKEGTSNGRPIYVEKRKTDRLAFDDYLPSSYGPHQPTIVKPAEIRYCGGHWIFTHEYISKSNAMQEECNWLIRSQKDDGFDLLEVIRKWDLWAGVISNAEVSIKCNACSDNTDCNLNGICNSAGVCECDTNADVLFLGTHCESKLREKCQTIVSEADNRVWSVDDEAGFMVSDDDIFQLYSRPVYSYRDRNDTVALWYSGLRWYVTILPLTYDASMAEYWEWLTSNFHGFWSDTYDTSTFQVSDPTANDSPIGVDFYEIRERSAQFGPFGFLVPMQTAGRGLFRCEGDAVACTFCVDGLTAPSETVINPASQVTCGYVHGIFVFSLKEGEELCSQMQQAEWLCCPGELDNEADTCSFCSDGITVEDDFIIPDSDGLTCSSLREYSSAIKQNDDVCQDILLAEDVCCTKSCTFCEDGIMAEEDYIIPESGGQTCSSLRDITLTLQQSDDNCSQIQLAERACCSLA